MTRVDRVMLAEKKTQFDALLKDAKNSIKDPKKHEILDKWVTEIKNKLKSEAYDVLETIASYYKYNEPFGIFTEAIEDPRGINKTNILKMFDEAKQTSRPLDEFVVVRQKP